MKSETRKRTEPDMDDLQFAERPHRGVEDATATLSNKIFKHLEGRDTNVKLCIYFTSAFNSIQLHVLMERLVEQSNLSNNLVGW